MKNVAYPQGVVKRFRALPFAGERCPVRSCREAWNIRFEADAGPQI